MSHFGPNSSDLNPGDYKIWEVMKERIYQMNIHNVDELRQRLMIDVAMSGNVGKTHVYVMSPVAATRRCLIRAVVTPLSLYRVHF